MCLCLPFTSVTFLYTLMQLSVTMKLLVLHESTMIHWGSIIQEEGNSDSHCWIEVLKGSQNVAVGLMLNSGSASG